MATFSDSDSLEGIGQSQSAQISTLLDSLGLSTEMVAIKILKVMAYKNIEDAIYNINDTPGRKPDHTYIATGSQAEGIGLVSMEATNSSSACSDFDTLEVKNTNVLEQEIVVYDGVEQVELFGPAIHRTWWPSRHNIIRVLSICTE
jgi:hypothetical protein